jgi:hypothetical protein
MKKSRLSFLSLSLAIVLCFSLALTAADGTIAAKNLTRGDSVIAFFETVGRINYLRAAYVVSNIPEAQ